MKNRNEMQGGPTPRPTPQLPKEVVTAGENSASIYSPSEPVTINIADLSVRANAKGGRINVSRCPSGVIKDDRLIVGPQKWCYVTFGKAEASPELVTGKTGTSVPSHPETQAYTDPNPGGKWSWDAIILTGCVGGVALLTLGALTFRQLVKWAESAGLSYTPEAQAAGSELTEGLATNVPVPGGISGNSQLRVTSNVPGADDGRIKAELGVHAAHMRQAGVSESEIRQQVGTAMAAIRDGISEGAIAYRTAVVAPEQGKPAGIAVATHDGEKWVSSPHNQNIAARMNDSNKLGSPTVQQSSKDGGKK